MFPDVYRSEFRNMRKNLSNKASIHLTFDRPKFFPNLKRQISTSDASPDNFNAGNRMKFPGCCSPDLRAFFKGVGRFFGVAKVEE
jgi:hypothetical protein